MSLIVKRPVLAVVLFGLNVTTIEQVLLTSNVAPVQRSVPFPKRRPAIASPIWKVKGAVPVFVKMSVAEAVEPTV